ncbi:chaperone protein DnaJ, putative [Theileria equi strain WA]|uniref:Chaperone protein DnaJ, putative n=1 Tax=Theileria equi strain WA TaxID=1537102 RepID=L0AUC9_THEEQ|nr:chaperone protein DnaJ, putative [Theileria equi strain WA]AFZ79242.1 chaperone protein DnaJ, putative [Theileria equi strain WA]|eukprot:XP_004828908.1 chaperone protein DnaJ, putative [Theileria equi strain WA]
MTWPLIAAAIGGGLLAFRYVNKKFPNLLKQNASMLPGQNGGPFKLSRQNLQGFEQKMTLNEAYSILNISSTSSKDKIRESYKQLMMRNHPDNGGSTYLASKVNEAKDFLVK